MFQIAKGKSAQKVATAHIIRGVDIAKFFAQPESVEIVLCPTNAIQIKENSIRNESCVSCFVCKSKEPDTIVYSCEKNDFKKFSEYCKGDKAFVYQWLAELSNLPSGIEIGITGDSRKKRIPLLILNPTKKELFLIKASRDSHNILDDYEDLNDFLRLVRTAFPRLQTRGIIVMLKDNPPIKKALLKEINATIVQISAIYAEIAEKHVFNIYSFLVR